MNEVVVAAIGRHEVGTELGWEEAGHRKDAVCDGVKGAARLCENPTGQQGGTKVTSKACCRLGSQRRTETVTPAPQGAGLESNLTSWKKRSHKIQHNHQNQC